MSSSCIAVEIAFVTLLTLPDDVPVVNFGPPQHNETHDDSRAPGSYLAELNGNSHGQLEPVGKQWDVGVDSNDFYPVSFDRLAGIMAERPENPGS